MAVEKAKNIPPFVRFCAASVPMVFDNSLSYYECLCALTKQLQEIVDVVNVNAEQLQGLLEGFEELKSYVDNYFENLDVQAEINAKLDEMAEGGQLAAIIAQFLAAAPVFGYGTIAEMAAATNLNDGCIARVLGNSTASDGDGAYYLIRDIEPSDDPDGLNLVAIGDSLVGERVIDAVDANLTARVTALENAKGHMVVIGDSFSTTTYNPAATAWYTIVAKRLGLTVHNYSKDSAGYIHVGTGSRTFSLECDDAIADSSFNNNSVEYVIVYGGLNDMNTTDISGLNSAAAALFDKIAANFPNAKIICAGINVWPSGFWVNGIKTTANYWYDLKSYCSDKGVIFINTMYWLADDANTYYDAVNYHPNVAGNALFATNLLTAMFGTAGTIEGNIYPLTSTATTGSGSLILYGNNAVLKIEGNATTTGGTAVIPIPKHALASFQMNNTILGVSASNTVCWRNRNVNEFTIHGDPDNDTKYYFAWTDPQA